MTKIEQYNKFKKIFMKQMGLDLSEAIEIVNDKFLLKIELIGISMASMRLDLTSEEHKEMAEFLRLIQEDNK